VTRTEPVFLAKTTKTDLEKTVNVEKDGMMMEAKNANNVIPNVSNVTPKENVLNVLKTESNLLQNVHVQVENVKLMDLAKNLIILVLNVPEKPTDVLNVQKED
jgi:uncharacterized protein YjiK